MTNACKTSYGNPPVALVIKVNAGIYFIYIKDMSPAKLEAVILK